MGRNFKAKLSEGCFALYFCYSFQFLQELIIELLLKIILSAASKKLSEDWIMNYWRQQTHRSMVAQLTVFIGKWMTPTHDFASKMVTWRWFVEKMNFWLLLSAQVSLSTDIGMIIIFLIVLPLKESRLVIT